ncbi:MAG: hypothetical protein JXA33_20595 [Anaerolineae bacterium]|nr:hypothetical protein [Anaerolineae bacterium]
MVTPNLDIWQFTAQLSENLMRWAGFSISTGTIWVLKKDRAQRGLGGQFIGWGLINAGLAYFGMQGSQRKSATPDAHTPEAQAQERANLRRLLWINTGLDVIYVVTGFILTLTKGKHNDLNKPGNFWRGTGWGIVIQGAFLFFFDLLHAAQLTELES